MSATDVRNALATLVATKRTLCRREACYELSPMLEATWADGVREHTIIPNRDAIPITVEVLRRSRDVPITGLAYLGEVAFRFYEGVSRDEIEQTVQAGDQLRALEAGDMTVREALMVTFIDTEGCVSIGTQVFRYDDAGQPVFDQADIQVGVGDQVQGEVPAKLREAMQP